MAPAILWGAPVFVVDMMAELVCSLKKLRGFFGPVAGVFAVALNTL